MRADEVFEDTESKNQIVPFINPSLHKDTIILRFVPINALVVLQLDEEKKEANQVHSINKGESLAIITQVKTDGYGFKQKRFLSVGKPKKIEEKNFGMIDSEIELYDCTTLNMYKKITIKVEYNYFENTKLDHFASLASTECKSS